MTDIWNVTRGKGSSSDNACIMVRASLEHARRNGYIDQLPLGKVLIDHPCWANEVVTNIAIRCNDSASDEDRQRIKPLLDRVLRCERRAPDVERRINARILCTQARKVLHLIHPKCRNVYEHALATREAWLRGEATENQCIAAAAAAADVYAADAADGYAAYIGAAAAAAAYAAAAANAAYDAAYDYVADTAYAASKDFDPIAWLDEALDMWEKAAAEEGAMFSDGEAERLVSEFVQSCGA